MCVLHVCYAVYLDHSCDSYCSILVYSWLTRVSSNTRLMIGSRGCHSPKAVHLWWGCSAVTHGWGASQPWSLSMNVNVLDLLTCLSRYLYYSWLYLLVSSWLIRVRIDTRLRDSAAVVVTHSIQFTCGKLVQWWTLVNWTTLVIVELIVSILYILIPQLLVLLFMSCTCDLLRLEERPGFGCSPWLLGSDDGRNTDIFRCFTYVDARGW